MMAHLSLVTLYPSTSEDSDDSDEVEDSDSETGEGVRDSCLSNTKTLCALL